MLPRIAPYPAECKRRVQPQKHAQRRIEIIAAVARLRGELFFDPFGFPASRAGLPHSLRGKARRLGHGDDTHCCTPEVLCVQANEFEPSSAAGCNKRISELLPAHLIYTVIIIRLVVHGPVHGWFL